VTSPRDEALEALRDRVKAAAEAGDHLAAHDALVQLGASLTGQRQLTEATAALSHAAEHARLGGDVPRRIASLRGYGALLRRMPKREQEAESVLRTSALLARKEGDVQSEALARRELLVLLLASQQWSKAAGEATASLELLGDKPDSMAKIEFLRGRAAANKARGRMGAASDDLMEAERMAREGGADRLSLELRLEIRGAEYLRDGGAPEDVDAILRDAADVGADDVVVTARFQEAAAALATDADRAAEIGEELRVRARETADPLTYLMASLLVAEARERQADDAEVIRVLVTCRNSLKDAFGPKLSSHVTPILDSLPTRWGKERFGKALAQVKAGVR